MKKAIIAASLGLLSSTATSSPVLFASSLSSTKAALGLAKERVRSENGPRTDLLDALAKTNLSQRREEVAELSFGGRKKTNDREKMSSFVQTVVENGSDDDGNENADDDESVASFGEYQQMPKDLRESAGDAISGGDREQRQEERVGVSPTATDATAATAATAVDKQQQQQQQQQRDTMNDHHQQNFIEFMKLHGKNYCGYEEIEKPCAESLKREKIFELNLMKMKKHNAKQSKAFGMRVTEFADLTQEEFISKHLTYKSWKKEQMEIAANRAGRQPDDPNVQIPQQIEQSFEKTFGKMEKDAEDEVSGEIVKGAEKQQQQAKAQNAPGGVQNNNNNNNNKVSEANNNNSNNNNNNNNSNNNNNNKSGSTTPTPIATTTTTTTTEASEGKHEKDDKNNVGDVIKEIEAEFTSDDYDSVDSSLFSSGKSLLGVDNYPEEFSWTNPPEGWPRDLVGEVHDQRDTCASCWAFVSADSIAARAAVMTKDNIVILSVKQLMNCDTRDHGCNTGNMYTAYMYVDEAGGIASKDKYDLAMSSSGYTFPSEEDQDEMQCLEDNVEKKWTTPGMCDIAQTEGNDALMKAIYEKGPVAIGINANNLQMYDEGVIKFEDCGPAGRGIASINHAAMVVGWGVDAKYGNTPYWLVKNSYGTSFGEDGYFKLERGPRGPVTLNDNLYDENGFSTCGLLFESVYPVVKHADDDGGAELGSDETCTAGSYYKREYRRDPTKNPGVSGTSSAALAAQLGQAISNGKGDITELDMIKMWDDQMRDQANVTNEKFTVVAPLASAMAAAFAVIALVARRVKRNRSSSSFSDDDISFVSNANEQDPLLSSLRGRK